MIAYLIEPTSVTQTGNIQGKSLRTYEVTVKEKTTSWGDKQFSFAPTGKLFTIKDDKIVEKSTSATLLGKNGWRIKTIHSNIDVKNVNYYSCSLFTSPIIALAAKNLAIKSRTNTIKQQLLDNLANIRNTLTKIPDTSFIAEEYPELFL